MDANERLQLKEMIKANNTEDNTEKIRRLKHSSLIKDNIHNYFELCNKYPNSHHKQFFKDMCQKKCIFLLKNYTDIYNKLIKNELNIQILLNFVQVLKQIEDGLLDQHDGSYMIGKLLKELYIDTALRRSEKMDKIESAKNKSQKPQKKSKNISYKEFKENNK